MVAYHYPPIQASSGVHRTLSFSSQLVRDGWRTTVLTVTRPALISYRQENEELVPPGVEVIRAVALDTTRHLTIRGKYPGLLAIPDRWASWILPAIACGLWHIWRRRPAFIFSTYPIASAHLIAYLLHRLTRITWIADFRDPMAQDGYPADVRTWKVFRWIESKVMRHAARVIFTAPGALDYYAETFPDAIRQKGIIIENGYDESMFALAERDRDRIMPRRGPIRMIHSGILYPSERDPSCFFAAVADLANEGAIAPGEVEFVLRGTGHDAFYAPVLEKMALTQFIKLAPPSNYREALLEMLEADALLVFQATNCNFQIPAKIYEYFRARRPIIAFTDPIGDTAAALAAGGVTWLARLDSVTEIKRVLREAIAAVRSARDEPFGNSEFIRSCSRTARAEEFKELLVQLTL